MAKDQDRQRLQQIEQTDITESRLNEDLVHWLKTSGPTYLLVILVGITAYLGWIRWQQHKQGTRNQAWVDLVNADRPETLEEIADAHKGIFAVPLLAREQAADSYVNAVLRGRDFSEDPALAPTLTDEQRTDYLAKADRLYESVVTAAREIKGDQDASLHVIYSLNGRAAVAEARGELQAAKDFYLEAATVADSMFPALASQSRARAESIDDVAQVVFLPGEAELPPAGLPPVRTPLQMDEVLQGLIFPEG